MSSYAFSKKQRLLDKKTFSSVFQEPTRSADHCFTILAKKNDLVHGRLGITVAKKNLKRAHERNLVKRLIRESFRLNQHKLQGFDFVVMTKRNITEHENHILYASLNKHWERIIKRCKPV